MWILGGVLLVGVVLGLVAWLWLRSARGAPPPELREDTSGPPEERDPTWDPRSRYDE